MRRRTLIYGISASLALWNGSQSFAGWTAIDLQPAGATSSVANGVRLGQVAGSVAFGQTGSATIWTGPTNALTPTYLGGGSAVATDGVEQVGTGPTLWSGTPGSAVSLTPTPPIPQTVGSQANGVFNHVQVGNVVYVSQNTSLFVSDAVYWTDSGASYVDINPAGTYGSVANGVDQGFNIAGLTYNGNGELTYAALWNNLPSTTVVDLNPTGSIESAANAISNSGGKEAGWVDYTTSFQAGLGEDVAGPYARAALWSGTAASFVDLSPAGSTGSVANGVFYSPTDTQVAGYAEFGGVTDAAYWDGTAASFQDLGTYLPAGFTSSDATGVWTSNQGVTYVTGYAVDGNGNEEAMLWLHTADVPEPASLAIALPIASIALLRRRRINHRSVP